MLDSQQTRQDCWTLAVHSYGTAYIFEQRAGALRRRLQWINYLGIAVPLAVGGLVGAFGASSSFVVPMQWVAGVLSVIQLLLSGWSLVAGWQASFEYSQESAGDNYRLAELLASLGRNPPSDLSVQSEIAKAQYQARSGADTKQGISDEEKRMGLRAALRKFERACSSCGKIPVSISPTSCGVCGNF